MTASEKRTEKEKRHEEWDRLSLVSAGFFLALVGVVLIITPNYYNEAVAFVKDFKIVEISPNITLVEPISNHPVVYRAVAQFCLAFGMLQIAILGLRFLFKDSVKRKAGTIATVIFWLGAGYVSTLLLTQAIGWFAYLSGLLVFIGLWLVVRNLLVLVFFKPSRGAV